MSEQDKNDSENGKLGGVGAAVSGFFAGVSAEFSRIIWPKGKELKESTVVVLSFIVILALAILIFDSIIRKILSFLVGA